jgi:hypothetical protein
VLRTLAPLNGIATTPFDLHVLSTPPAFVLSQNQTLRKEFVLFSAKEKKLNLTVHNLLSGPLNLAVKSAQAGFVQSYV